MKVESRTESPVGTWEGLSRFLPQGVTLFATGLSGFLLILIGLPVLMVILMSLRTGFPGENVPFTLENFATVYLTPRTYEILLNTVFFAVSSVAITLLIAVPLVWILMRTDIPFKKTIYVLLTIGILIPVFLRTIAWILLLSPRIGLVNKWLQEIFALSEPPFNLYSLTGMAFVQGVSFVPGAFFMLAAAYRSMDPSLEEAAYTSGVGKLRTFLKINIPITWPAIAAVMVYLIMTAIAVFEVPAIIGLPARIHVLSSLIFTSTTPSTGLPDYGMAGAYGAIMLVLGLTFAFLYVRLVKQGKKYTVITGRGYRPREIALGRWKWAALAFVFFYLCDRSFHSFRRAVVGLVAALFAVTVGGSSFIVDLQTLYRDAQSRRRSAVHQYADLNVLRAHDHDDFERAGVMDRDPNAGLVPRFPGYAGFYSSCRAGDFDGSGIGVFGIGLPGLFPAVRHCCHHCARAHHQLDRLRHANDQQRHDPSPP